MSVRKSRQITGLAYSITRILLFSNCSMILSFTNVWLSSSLEASKAAMLGEEPTPLSGNHFHPVTMRPLMIFFIFAALVCCSADSKAQNADFHLAPLFTDNMVLQQKQDVPIWGMGAPGTPITIRTTWGVEESTQVGADRQWRLTVHTPAAGGPHQVDIWYGETPYVLNNVLIGEVWLCSGQSNMEMPLEGWPPGDTISNAKEEIRNSANPSIRLFTVKRTCAATPAFDCAGGWTECSPVTSRQFSAVAYFFGTYLHDKLKVPIGLIHSSWGGTAIASWMSADVLAQLPEFDSTLKELRESLEGNKRLQTWLESFPIVDMRNRQGENRWAGLDFQDGSCSSTTLSDSAWKVMRLPTNWERTSMGEFDGTVWFRKQITIPQAWVHHDLTLDVGPVDDIDVTFVNGQKVGSHEGEGLWQVNRIYRIPGSLVDSTKLLVAVRVIDYQGGGGIYGKDSLMFVQPEGGSERVSLAGDWKFLPVAELRGDRFFVFGTTQHYFDRPTMSLEISAYVPTTLFNGMIAPLAPAAIKGVIWYQGESDAGHPAKYAQLLPLMIENWRSAFQAPDLPFDFVQIAPYAYGSGTTSQLLREAQMLTLSEKNTGMAVTLDLGSARTIHPGDKQDVGKRLALIALANTYHQRLTFSGPLYKSFKITGQSIQVNFDYAAKGLVVKSRVGSNGFQIAGEDHVFKDATVRIRGKSLLVSNSEIKNPQAVRYAWADVPEATLYNVDGLPASSFRTDNWDR